MRTRKAPRRGSTAHARAPAARGRRRAPRHRLLGLLAARGGAAVARGGGGEPGQALRTARQVSGEALPTGSGRRRRRPMRAGGVGAAAWRPPRPEPPLSPRRLPRSRSPRGRPSRAVGRGLLPPFPPKSPAWRGVRSRPAPLRTRARLLGRLARVASPPLPVLGADMLPLPRGVALGPGCDESFADCYLFLIKIMR